MRLLSGLLLGLMAASAASAQTLELKPNLCGLGFLVGHWSSPMRAKVADTGGSSQGEASFTSEVGGAVLLRKDHVTLYDASGKPAGDFDILMMIYPEGGGVRADYADGEHVIHYASADIDPGRAVTFNSAPVAGAPTFRLSYTLVRPALLDVTFSMAPPGASTYQPIASGSLARAP